MLTFSFRVLFIAFFVVDSDTTRTNGFPFHCIERFPSNWFLAILNKRSLESYCLKFEVNVTPHMENAETDTSLGAIKRYFRLTYPADETIRVPLTVKSRNVIFHNWTVASSTFRSEHVEEVIATIWFALPFVETFLPKLFPALCTKEVFGVPRFLQSGDAFLKKENNQNPKIMKSRRPCPGFPKNNLRPKLVRCSMHISGRTNCDSPIRNRGLRLFRRSSSFQVLGCSEYT